MQRRGSNRGRPHREPKEYDEQVIQIDRVTKVVKGGRRLRFRATVCIGNRKGKVGIGLGKSNEVTGAIQKAIAKAKKDLITVPIDGSTIPHDIRIKCKSSDILILPAAPGTGLIAGGTIRKVLELAGIKDVLSKSYGTTNKVNNTKATIEGLKSLRETPRMAREAKKRAAAKTKAKETAATKPATPNKEEKKDAPAKATTPASAPKETPKNTPKEVAKKEAPKKDAPKTDTPKDSTK